MKLTKDDTTFTAASTSHPGGDPAGNAPLLMSAQGKALAAKTAPVSAFQVRTSAAKEK